MVRKTLSKRIQLHVDVLEERAVPATVIDVVNGASILGAIDSASSGDTVVVKACTYNETLTITTDYLSIVTREGAVIHPTTISSNGAIVDIVGATDVIFKGFEVDASVLTAAAGASDFDSAIRVTGDGSATIRDNTIKGLFDADGYTEISSSGFFNAGFAIHVGDFDSQTTPNVPLGSGTAKIINNDIQDFFKNGVIVEPGAVGATSKAVIRGNTITGVSDTGTTLVEQAGIQILGAADLDSNQDVSAEGTVIARVKSNTVQNVVEDSEFSPTGIRVQSAASEDKVLLFENLVKNNGFGIDILNSTDDVKVYHNDVIGNGFAGIVTSSSDNTEIIGNLVKNNGKRNDTLVVDFEGDSAFQGFGADLNSGDVVTNQFQDNEFGTDVGFVVTAKDNLGNAADAMIFDTTVASTADPDLVFSDGSQGNALIISEDGNTTNPDDNANGGTLAFTFDSRANVKDITLLDIEPNQTVTIKALDSFGTVVATKSVTGGMGDNTALTVDLEAASFFGLKSLVVETNGSIAVSDFTYGKSFAGIEVVDSNNVDIIGNLSNDSGYSGIYVLGGSNNYIKFDVTNYNFGDGITLENTTGNDVYANLALGNVQNGISVINSTFNSVRTNFVIANSGFGIITDAVSEDPQSGNTVEDNLVFGNEEGNIEEGVDGSSDYLTAAYAVDLGTDVEGLDEGETL
ncbi:MAG: right-handed parallel beta-helix repeat-containing protein [Gemmataceae bacterium]